VQEVNEEIVTFILAPFISSQQNITL